LHDREKMRDLIETVLIFGIPLLLGFKLGYWVRSRQSAKRRLRHRS
jgi:hypothetical protein